MPNVPSPGFDECNGAISPGCNGQTALYTVGTMVHFGRPASEAINMSPWKGVTGLANTGWLWRVTVPSLGVDGAPSFFEIGDFFNIPRGSFVVLAVSYPAQTTFTVNLHYYWGQPKDTTLPMASRDTVFQADEKINPVGLAWHFDGSFLYLRVVSPGCYIGNNCANTFFEVDGVRVWSQINSHKIQVLCF